MSRRQALQKLKISDFKPDRTNPGLWFNKYIDCADRQKPEEFNQIFSEMEKLAKPRASYPRSFARWKTSLEKAGATPVKASCLGRVVIGLGNESALETSITLHHTYGVPIIPGSALKGVAASFAARELDGWDRDGEAFQQLFGYSKKSGQGAGCVVFHDAWPDPGNTNLFTSDVINVHHKEYYQAKANEVSVAPADWDDPVPISFLTSSGDFWIAVSGESPEWNQAALEILQMALEEYGVGAKTSRGYGRFKIKTLPTIEPESSSGSAATSAPSETNWQEGLSRITSRDKNIFNTQVTAWKDLKNEAQKLEFGKAILAKLDELGWSKAWKKKGWYEEIVTFVNETS